MWKENRGQGSIEILLAAGIAIVLATIVGLILKGLSNQVAPTVQNQTNALVNTIA